MLHERLALDELNSCSLAPFDRDNDEEEEEDNDDPFYSFLYSDPWEEEDNYDDFWDY